MEILKPEELKEKLRRLKISRASILKKYLITKSASFKDVKKISKEIRTIEEALDKIRLNRLARIMGK